MRAAHLIAGLVALFTSAGAACADTIAAGPLNVPGQQSVVCRVYNPGPTAVTLAARRIVRADGTALILQHDTCSVLLAPNRSCAYSHSNDSGDELFKFAALSCRITGITAGAAAQLRGSMQAKGSLPLFVGTDIANLPTSATIDMR